MVAAVQVAAFSSRKGSYLEELKLRVKKWIVVNEWHDYDYGGPLAKLKGKVVFYFPEHGERHEEQRFKKRCEKEGVRPIQLQLNERNWAHTFQQHGVPFQIPVHADEAVALLSASRPPAPPAAAAPPPAPPAAAAPPPAPPAAAAPPVQVLAPIPGIHPFQSLNSMTTRTSPSSVPVTVTPLAAVNTAPQKKTFQFGTFGAGLSHCRNQAGDSQGSLAREMDYTSNSAVSKDENGGPVLRRRYNHYIQKYADLVEIAPPPDNLAAELEAEREAAQVLVPSPAVAQVEVEAATGAVSAARPVGLVGLDALYLTAKQLGVRFYVDYDPEKQQTSVMFRGSSHDDRPPEEAEEKIREFLELTRQELKEAAARSTSLLAYVDQFC